MHVRVMVCLGMAAVSGTPVAAQVEPFEPADGFLEPTLVVGSEVFSRCTTELIIRVRGPVEDLGCEVVDTVVLDDATARSRWMLQYLRSAGLSRGARVDTVSIDELALVRPRRSGFEVVWHLARDRTYEFLSQVESIAIQDGVLVSYFVCANGTGGCAEQFLFGKDQWVVVAQPFLDDLAARVPDGWSFHKGRDLDLATLTGIQPISLPGDANCCPSGMMTFKVELQDDELRLVSATVGGDR